MRKYAIGFEVLKKDVSYTGEVLYKHLHNVLTDYNIKDRIISITRDNASPINCLVTKFKASLVNEDDVEEFSGDLRYFGHIMNLATTAFLTSVHLKTTKSKAFFDTLKPRKEMSPHLKDTFDLMETMSHIVDTHDLAYLTDIHEILEIFVIVTKQVQGDTYETCNKVIPWASKIVADLNRLMAGRLARNNPLIALGLEGAKEKILQYYPIYAMVIEPIEDLYLATMLEPQMKLNTLKKTEHQKELDKEGSGQKRQRKNEIAKSKKSEETSMSFFYDASQLGDDEDHDGESELRRYFSQESAKVYEQIAKDYLSMMAMSSPSESLFSQLKSIVTDKRNRFQPITIKILAILEARGVIRDDASVYIDSGRDSDEATNNSNQYHTKVLDTNCEKHSSGMTQFISANIVNFQDVDDGKKRKRSEARGDHRSLIMSGTECADNSDLQRSTGLSEMKDIGACGSQNSGNTSDAESFDTTHDSPEKRDRGCRDFVFEI